MDEAGAVNKARDKLERRRQEAYRARAAATVKIQRWYRRCRDARRGVRSPLDDNNISYQQSTEESFTESTSATLSIASEQESRGDCLNFILPWTSKFTRRAIPSRLIILL